MFFHRLLCLFGLHEWTAWHKHKPNLSRPFIHAIPYPLATVAQKAGRTVQVCEWCPAYRTVKGAKP